MPSKAKILSPASVTSDLEVNCSSSTSSMHDSCWILDLMREISRMQSVPRIGTRNLCRGAATGDEGINRLPTS
jgi:hypothetical protein